MYNSITRSLFGLMYIFAASKIMYRVRQTLDLRSLRGNVTVTYCQDDATSSHRFYNIDQDFYFVFLYQFNTKRGYCSQFEDEVITDLQKRDVLGLLNFYLYRLQYTGINNEPCGSIKINTLLNFQSIHNARLED